MSELNKLLNTVAGLKGWVKTAYPHMTAGQQRSLNGKMMNCIEMCVQSIAEHEEKLAEVKAHDEAKK